MSFLSDDLERRTRKLYEVEKMTGQRKTTSHLAMHLINTRLGAENEETEPDKYRV
jgi:hypothetical protein